MNLLYLTAPGAILAAIALSFAIPALVRRARIDALATLPVAPEQRVELLAGDVILHLSGRLGTTKFASLSFELIDAAGGTVPSRIVVMRSRRSVGLFGVLLAVRRFRVPAAGSYKFRVTGITADRDYSDCRLVFARPQDAGLVLSVIGVVLSAVLLIVCTVLSLILWLSPAAMAAAPIEQAVAPPAATPPRDSPERRDLLDAVRKRAKLSNASRLKVHHLRVAGQWAYFVGNEVAHVERSEWQETDLSIEALLERDMPGWRVAEYWSLPTEDRYSRRDFERRVSIRRGRDGIPASIFPKTK